MVPAIHHSPGNPVAKDTDVTPKRRKAIDDCAICDRRCGNARFLCRTLGARLVDDIGRQTLRQFPSQVTLAVDACSWQRLRSATDFDPDVCPAVVDCRQCGHAIAPRPKRRAQSPPPCSPRASLTNSNFRRPLCDDRSFGDSQRLGSITVNSQPCWPNHCRPFSLGSASGNLPEAGLTGIETHLKS